MKKEERELLVERVAFLTALQKKVKEHLDAHAANNLRTQLDDELKNLYVQMGVSKLDLKVNGKKVGTVSARLSKPKVEVVPQVKSVAEFVDWIMTSDSGIDTLTVLSRSIQTRYWSAQHKTVSCQAVARWSDVRVLSPGLVPHSELTLTK